MGNNSTFQDRPNGTYKEGHITGYLDAIDEMGKRLNEFDYDYQINKKSVLELLKVMKDDK